MQTVYSNIGGAGVPPELMNEETNHPLPTDGPESGRISRRAFFIIFLGGLIGLIAWMYRREAAALAIQNFFGLDNTVKPVIEQELQSLKKGHFSWWTATVFFFTLADWGLQSIVPGRLRFRIINYWSWKLFSRRSIAWKYVNYPSVGDDPICDGLIRPE